MYIVIYQDIEIVCWFKNAVQVHKYLKTVKDKRDYSVYVAVNTKAFF